MGTTQDTAGCCSRGVLDGFVDCCCCWFVERVFVIGIEIEELPNPNDVRVDNTRLLVLEVLRELVIGASLDGAL